jgi:hypothetical protein
MELRITQVPHPHHLGHQANQSKTHNIDQHFACHVEPCGRPGAGTVPTQSPSCGKFRRLGVSAIFCAHMIGFAGHLGRRGLHRQRCASPGVFSFSLIFFDRLSVQGFRITEAPVGTIDHHHYTCVTYHVSLTAQGVRRTSRFSTWIS